VGPRTVSAITTTGGGAVLGDLAGIGPVRDALVTTNTLLEQVLDELQKTNEAQLDAVIAEMRTMNATLRELARDGARVGATD
jgi:hypothetical protein